MKLKKSEAGLSINYQQNYDIISIKKWVKEIIIKKIKKWLTKSRHEQGNRCRS